MFAADARNVIRHLDLVGDDVQRCTRPAGQREGAGKLKEKKVRLRVGHVGGAELVDVGQVVGGDTLHRQTIACKPERVRRLRIDGEVVAQRQALVAVDQAGIDGIQQVARKQRSGAVVSHEVAREDVLPRRDGGVHAADPLVFVLRVGRGIRDVSGLVGRHAGGQELRSVLGHCAVRCRRNGSRAGRGTYRCETGCLQPAYGSSRADGARFRGAGILHSLEIRCPVTRQLRTGGDHRGVALGDTQCSALVSAEKEMPVVPDGSAKVSAILVALERVHQARDAIAGVGVVVAQELEGSAMELVAAGFRDDVDGAAGMHAVLRRKPRRLHRELLQGVREGEGKVGVEAVVVVVAAIQQEVDLVGLSACDRHRDRTADRIHTERAVAAGGSDMAGHRRRGAS